MPQSAGCFPCRIAASFIFLAILLAPVGVSAQLDLGKLERVQLDNGLSLLMLEEHSFPSVSVQMLYRVGGRNEPAGQSGIAHFLEHMAFRATENFPETDVVSQIYAAGGEWHGYTWIDQTTYFATVPSDRLDLLLRIEADRMQRLLIEPRWLEAEKGAVLAEMHGYENDPASVLHDAVVFTAFQAHPYRNNVIGWEADILALQHQDVLDFYRRYYLPANAVLAIVGNFDRRIVAERVRALFGAFPSAAATPLPHTTEPAQTGERRIEMLGAGDSSYFEIAYPAPAANDPDFAAMLVLQQWLAGGSGVNFMQRYGTTSMQAGTRLDGQLGFLATWFAPAAQNYLFSFQGSMAAGKDLQGAEEAIESALQRVRSGELDEAEISHSRERVLEELVFDLSSHEHTAHQLAFFHGLDALDEWLDLPRQVAEVSTSDLQSLAQRHMQPWQRTVGWYRAGARPALIAGQPGTAVSPDPGQTTDFPGKTATGILPMDAGVTLPLDLDVPSSNTFPPPEKLTTKQGGVILLQQNPATASSFVSLVIEGRHWQGSSYLQNDQPVWGYSSLSAESLPDKTDETLGILLQELSRLTATVPGNGENSDPSDRLQFLMEEMLGLQSVSPPPEGSTADISLVVLSGTVPLEQLKLAQGRLGALAATVLQEGNAARQGPAAQVPAGDSRVEWPFDLAQAQLAFVAPAPLPADDDYLAWRALQYILTHDYEGRLGREAISNRGLAYFIDSQYNSDGRRAWLGLSTGVDPAKLRALEALFRQQVNGLQQQPPTEAEAAEARNHLLGRLATAHQTNAELAAGLAEHWLWYNELPDRLQQRRALSGLQRREVLAVVPGFLQGRYAVIAAGKTTADVTD